MPVPKRRWISTGRDWRSTESKEQHHDTHRNRGGSSQWMKSLIRDVYLLDEIDGGEIRLVDPKRENVEAEARVLETSN